MESDTINPLAFLDLVDDVLGIICELLTFTEQLSLRITCRNMLPRIDSKKGKLLYKIEESIYKFNKFLREEYGTLEYVLGREIFTIPLPLRNCYHDINWNKSPQMLITILYKEYNLKNIFDAVGPLIILNKLIELLELDAKLREMKKSFDRRDRRYISQVIVHNVYDHNVCKYQVERNKSHINRINGCYKKFNYYLKEIFGENEWLNIVKNMISGKVELISINKINEINDKLTFGGEIMKNYKEIRHVLRACK